MGNDSKYCVLATRPEAQNQTWLNRLITEGYDVLAMPLLELITVSDRVNGNAIKSQVLNLDHYQKLIFVSQNAVNHAFEWIDRYWPQFPIGIECYCVGKKTASVLNHHLQQSSISIATAEQAMNSEELLSLPGLQQVAKEKVLIFKGVGGRTKIQSELENRGAHVECCDLYLRVPKEIEFARFTQCINSLETIEKMIVPVFSGESIENFHRQISEKMNDWPKIQIIAPGERVALIAKNLGFESITIAKNASEGEMMLAIARASKQLGSEL